MKIVNVENLSDNRIVRCPKNGFVSRRILLKRDNMGYTLTETEIFPQAGMQFWHYKNHLESCYCILGRGILTNTKTGEQYDIVPGVTYILDKHDPHTFQALELTKLICVFTPPLIGSETHRADGSYAT